MSREAYLNQRVGSDVRPAGRLADWVPLSAWVKELPRAKYPQVVKLLKEGVAEEPATLEAELIEAFLAHEPLGEMRPPVEALLLAVLGREPDAAALGFADYLPLSGANSATAAPVTILDRAVKVGERTWGEWPAARRRREYLLLEFYDAALSDPRDEKRNQRITASLRLLAGQ